MYLLLIYYYSNITVDKFQIVLEKKNNITLLNVCKVFLADVLPPSYK